MAGVLEVTAPIFDTRRRCRDPDPSTAGEETAMPELEFLWTFPCFVLATQFNRDSETGTVLFDEGFRVVALSLTSDAEKQVPIFTDEALAEDYAGRSASTGLTLVEISTPEALKDFLLLASRAFKHAAIDLSPKAKFSRLFLIDEILAQIDDWIGQSE
ncbi:MAG: hypothetical protein ACI8P0_005627 [Planctomycetaceae bacterium]|jgi:hypothetical protein